MRIRMMVLLSMMANILSRVSVRVAYNVGVSRAEQPTRTLD
jgi:hypothetical protein